MVSTIAWPKTKINPILRHIYNAECPLMMSAEAARAHITRKSKRVIHVSHPQENKKLMSRMSQFSRRYSSLFKDRKKLIHESHPWENEKLLSTMSQCSRTDSLLFKGRSFSWTPYLIYLVKQIQSFQKGWTLKLDVSVKQSKMFHFWTLKSIISQKSVTCWTEIQSLSFFSGSGFDHAHHTL